MFSFSNTEELSPHIEMQPSEDEAAVGSSAPGGIRRWWLPTTTLLLDLFKRECFNLPLDKDTYADGEDGWYTLLTLPTSSVISCSDESQGKNLMYSMRAQKWALSRFCIIVIYITLSDTINKLNIIFKFIFNSKMSIFLIICLSGNVYLESSAVDPLFLDVLAKWKV